MSVASEIRRGINAIKRRERAKKQAKRTYQDLVKMRNRYAKRGDLDMAASFDRSVKLLDACLDKLEGKDPDIENSEPETIDITRAA